MVAPVVEQLAEDFAGRVKIGKVDVDSNKDLAARYNIRGIPTLLFFKGGEVVDQVIGAVPGDQIKAKLEAL
jgi:thioredoxin 1